MDPAGGRNRDDFGRLSGSTYRWQTQEPARPAAMGGDMRRLIVSSLVSLDGVHGDPQSWVGDYFDDQAAEESLAVLLDSDAMLMGRNTYDYFAPRWSSPSGPYLERIYQMRKYVFSSTLT